MCPSLYQVVVFFLYILSFELSELQRAVPQGKNEPEKNPTNQHREACLSLPELRGGTKVSLIICTHKPLLREFDYFYIYIGLETLDEKLC